MDDKLLEILRCPSHPDGPPLSWKGSLLICMIDGVGYRITDGIPNMLLEDSLPAEVVAAELKAQDAKTI